MGSASYPEAGKGQRECILPMFPCGSSLVARLYLVKNEAPEEEAAYGMVQTSSPLKISRLWFLRPLHLLPFLTTWPQLFKSWLAL